MSGYVEEIRKLVGSKPIILNSAGLFLRNLDGEILLVNRIDTDNWGVPGGYMELGETFEETLVRELTEELQIQVAQFRLFTVFSGKDFYHEYPNGDKVYSIIALYISENFSGELNVDNKEIREARFFAPDAIPANLTRSSRRIIEYVRGRGD